MPDWDAKRHAIDSTVALRSFKSDISRLAGVGTGLTCMPRLMGTRMRRLLEDDECMLRLDGALMLDARLLGLLVLVVLCATCV
jgi:hypothetical protein